MINLNSLADLPVPVSYWYIATPYSRYVDGIDEAYREARRISSALDKADIAHYCPILWTHLIAERAKIDKLNHQFWLAADRPYMNAASGLLIIKMEGWDTSFGIEQERQCFTSEGKPIYAIEQTAVVADRNCDINAETCGGACHCGQARHARRVDEQPPLHRDVVERLFGSAVTIGQTSGA